MPLSNSQYNAIMRMYEEKQRRSRYLLEQRKDAVYQQIPEYEELDHQVSSTSIAQARKMLSGDSNALSELKEKLLCSLRIHPTIIQRSFKNITPLSFCKSPYTFAISKELRFTGTLEM